MGQGTDSCGGYNADYNPYEDGLIDGTWYPKNKPPIKVKDMSTKHVVNTLKMCQQLVYSATFDDERWLWQNWVDLFECELTDRSKEGVEK